MCSCDIAKKGFLKKGEKKRTLPVVFRTKAPNLMFFLEPLQGYKRHLSDKRYS